MPYTPTFVFESELIPGASYELRAVGSRLRHQTDLKLAKERNEIRLLYNRLLKIGTDIQGRERTRKPLTADETDEWNKTHDKPPSEQILNDEEIAELDRIDRSVTMLNATIQTGILEARLLKFSLPGEEYAAVKTIDNLLDFGPEGFVQEITAQATRGWQISEAERKNSESPISSAAPKDGAMSDGIATDANSKATTSAVTAV